MIILLRLDVNHILVRVELEYGAFQCRFHIMLIFRIIIIGTKGILVDALLCFQSALCVKTSINHYKFALHHKLKIRRYFVYIRYC